MHWELAIYARAARVKHIWGTHRLSCEAWLKAGKFDGQPHAELAHSKAQLQTECKPGTENCPHACWTLRQTWLRSGNWLQIVGKAMSIENRFAPARRKSMTNLTTVRQEHPGANPKTTVATKRQGHASFLQRDLRWPGTNLHMWQQLGKYILCMLAGPAQTQTQQWLQIGEGNFNLKMGLRWPGANLWQTLLQTNEGGRGRTYTNQELTARNVPSFNWHARSRLNLGSMPRMPP